MKCQSSADHDAATAAMRAQWNQTARGWSDSGAVVRPWLHQATQAMPCVTTLMSTALRHAGMPQRDPFQPGGLLSLGKPGLMDDLFREAGFDEIATTRIAAPVNLPAVSDYMKFIRTSAGPIVQIVKRLDAAKAEAAWADMEQALSRYETP